MMFDPPDYPYKEFCETYDPDNLDFHNITGSSDQIANSNKNLNVAAMITSVENQTSFQSNDSGRYFNVENAFSQPTDTSIEHNTELCVVQSQNLFNYEPTLLDENTVNQFLLPLQYSADANKDTVTNGPDLLALHSCVICHEIFTTESDLLDHTILLHASHNLDFTENIPLPAITDDQIDTTHETNKNNVSFETEWFVCRICERVLSTALEVEPNEQLCCLDNNGKSSTLSRKLHTMYVCDLCNGLFADGDALDRHRATCYVDEPIRTSHCLEETNECYAETSEPKYPEICYSCDYCGKQYSSTEELKVHSLECQKPIPRNSRRTYISGGNSKMWNCGSCNQLFTTARELYRHKRGEDRPVGAPLMAYVCEDCDKVLGSMCALHTHKKMHKVLKPGYPCRVCGRRFNQSGHLAIHMRMHTGERPYPCDLCPKAFKVKVERDDHRRTHTGERPFACTACPKTFTAAARLREHARIHTDQRPYRCDICGAAFRRPYARTVHTLIHTGEKPHECDVCGTAFRRSGDMWKHKRTLHGVQAGNLATELKNYRV